MCGIYKITNLINGKIYIGKSINIKQRWDRHKEIPNDNMLIHKAMLKYGIDNFSFKILEECDECQLDEKEKYWINYYNTYLGEGYNAAPGGEGASHPVKISNEVLNDIVNDLQNHLELSIKDIAKKYQVSSTTISSINTGNSRRIKDVDYPIRKSFQRVSKQELYDLLLKTQGDFNFIANNYKVSANMLITDSDSSSGLSASSSASSLAKLMGVSLSSSGSSTHARASGGSSVMGNWEYEHGSGQWQESASTQHDRPR